MDPTTSRGGTIPRTAPPVWIDTPAEPTPGLRRGRTLALLAMLGFAVALTLGVPMGIGSSWRECDTQAIARNFLLDDFDLLRPRIDWRGDTDGAVECEFPLYQALIALTMKSLIRW